MGDETSDISKAIQDVAKATDKALDIIKDTAGPLANMVIAVATNTIGLAGGDWIDQKRIQNLAGLTQRTREILEARQIDPQTIEATPSPSVVIPLIEAGQDEARLELQELFARLLANAADPERQGRVRREFIGIVRQMEPLDAMLFMEIGKGLTMSEWSEKLIEALPGTPIESGEYKVVEDLCSNTGRSWDEIDFAYRNLKQLGCVSSATNGSRDRLSGILLRIVDHFQQEENFRDLVSVNQVLPKSLMTYSISLTGRELLRSLEL